MKNLKQLFSTLRHSKSFKNFWSLVLILFLSISSLFAQWNPVLPVVAPTASIARSGSVNIGSAAAAAAPAGNPLLLLDAKASGANKTIGHLQANNWGTYNANDNWLELGVYAPAYGGSNHYGHRMGWDKYGLTFGLNGTSTTRHAYDMQRGLYYIKLLQNGLIVKVEKLVVF